MTPSLGPREPRAGLPASGSADNTLCRVVPRRPRQQQHARRWWRRPGESGAAVNLPSRTLGTRGISTAWELVRNAGPRVQPARLRQSVHLTALQALPARVPDGRARMDRDG